jgi:hypothetical protein
MKRVLSRTAKNKTRFILSSIHVEGKGSTEASDAYLKGRVHVMLVLTVSGLKKCYSLDGEHD